MRALGSQTVEQVWVALLRAVNLGKRNRVPMAALRALFEEAGCHSVRTYIQSGNVVFEHAAPDAGRFEAAVADAFGVRTAVVLRTGEQLRRLAASHPFGPDASSSAVAFPAGDLRPDALRALAELDVAPDAFAAVGPDLALRYPNGFAGARLTTAVLERQLGVKVTVRNWRTVARLAELTREGR